MAQLEKEQQILQLLKQSSSVLVALPEKPNTDAIAAGLAMLSVLEKLGKRSKAVSSGFELPANHTFLPKSNEIFDDLSTLKKFIISVDLQKTSVEELSYNINDDKLDIYLTPKDGYFEEKDVSTSAGDYAFDLIVAIDCQDLEKLGRIYELNTDFFYHTPVINIDNSPANDHFGQVDLINVTATSTSEIVFEMVKDWSSEDNTDLLDEYIATNLLTGMISQTKSFRSGGVTPRSLSIASHLIAQGARRDEIVKHLYQSKKVSQLKLWGRVLSKLEADEEHKIVWSHLDAEDIAVEDFSDDVLADAIDELIINTPDAKNVFILYTEEAHDDVPATVRGVISTAPYIQAAELFSDMNPEGSKHFVSVSVRGQDMEQVQKRILEKIRSLGK